MTARKTYAQFVIQFIKMPHLVPKKKRKKKYFHKVETSRDTKKTLKNVNTISSKVHICPNIIYKIQSFNKNPTQRLLKKLSQTKEKLKTLRMSHFKNNSHNFQ